MRVVSLVPSLTETLIKAGVEVVGRTRFCIHPKLQTANIPIIGGTKDWKWDAIKAQKPDYLILDKEENPKMMAEQSEIPYLATHIQSIQDMPASLRYLAENLKAPLLIKFAEEWNQVLKSPYESPELPKDEFLGICQWGRRPAETIKKVIYIIWKDPWMTISSDTFIGSMLAHRGLGKLIPKYGEKYLKIDLQGETNKQSTLLLFSTEPFPFLKKQDGLAELGFPFAFIDGEKFSWFGIRSLRFLQAPPP